MISPGPHGATLCGKRGKCSDTSRNLGMTSKKPKPCLRSYGDKEYFLDEFVIYFQKEGIHQEFTCRHTPQQNGVAERKYQHILEVARAIMNEKNLPRSSWVEATNTIVTSNTTLASVQP